MIKTHLLIIQIQWMVFIRILMTTTQAEKERSWLCLMIWLQTLWVTKNLKAWLKNYLFGAEKWIFHLFLSLSLIFLFEKMLDKIRHIIWLWKSATEKNYKILQLIILQIFILIILWGFTENAQENRIIFWLLTQHYRQVIL